MSLSLAPVLFSFSQFIFQLCFYPPFLLNTSGSWSLFIHYPDSIIATCSVILLQSFPWNYPPCLLDALPPHQFFFFHFSSHRCSLGHTPDSCLLAVPTDSASLMGSVFLPSCWVRQLPWSKLVPEKRHWCQWERSRALLSQLRCVDIASVQLYLESLCPGLKNTMWEENWKILGCWKCSS